MQDEYKEYVVGLKKFDDISVYDAIWAQIERDTDGIQHIPDEAIAIVDERIGSYRLCHYNMTDAQAELLRQHPQVEVVEIPAYKRPNLKVGLRTVQTGNFNKTLVKFGDNLNWGLIRHSITPNAYGSSLNTDQSYEYLFDGTGVDVVVHDTGLQVDHPEFTDAAGNSRVQLINWYTAAGITGRSQSAGVYTDTYGHGTHVGGIMAGKTYGWAKNSRIYVMPVEGLSPYGFDMNECFDLVKLWHRNKPVNPATGVKRPTVVNMSWGYSWDGYGDLSGNYRGQDITSLSSVHGVFGNALSVRVASVDINIQEMLDEGIVVVTAAGNANAKIDAPGGVDYNNYFVDGFDRYYYHQGMSPYAEGTINVGCLDYQLNGSGLEQKTTFSNAGPGVEIYAAGHHIMSSCSNTDGMGGSAPYYANSRFRQTNISGTSMASPQVSGLVALYLQVRPSASVAEVYAWVASQRTQLLYTTGLTDDYTNGRSQWGGNGGVISAYDIKQLLNTLPRMLDGAVTSTAGLTSTIPVTEPTANIIQKFYQTPGRYKLHIPSGVTTLNALCIGAGAGGAAGNRAGGGGGGAVRWKSDIDVRPGEILYITVGEGGTGALSTGHGVAGGDSFVTRSGEAVLLAGGGKRGRNGGPAATGGKGTNLSTYKFVNKNYNSVVESQAGDVDIINNRIYLPGHTLNNGDVVMYRSGRWDVPGFNNVRNLVDTFKNASDDLYENDLYFVHQVNGDWIKLQHYASSIPGWSPAGLKVIDDLPDYRFGDPDFDGQEQLWTNNPGTYDPNGEAVNLNGYSSPTYQDYDYLFKVKDNSVNYYGINLVANFPHYSAFGALVGWNRIWAIVWDLTFEKVYGGNGGNGGVDWVSYQNSYSPWYYAGGGGGAGAYGFDRAPQNTYDYYDKWWESGTGTLNANRVFVDRREILYRGEGGSGSSDYALSSSYSSVYSQKPLTGTMYGADGGGSSAARAGGGGGTGIAKFNDTTTQYNNTLNWYSSVGYRRPSGTTDSTGTSGTTRFGLTAGITSSTITLQEDGVASISINSGGTDYFPAPVIAVRPPRMYRVTSANVTDTGNLNSNVQPYRYGLRIVNHGYSGGELVGINSFNEDNSAVISQGSYYTFSGSPKAGYGNYGSSYTYIDILNVKPTGVDYSSYNGINQPVSVGPGTGRYYNGYINQYYTTYFFVEVIDKDNIRLYGDLLNRSSGYFTGVSGTVKIFNAEWWNWPSAHCTINDDTGAIESVVVDRAGRGMYNMGTTGTLTTTTPAVSVYGTGTNATFTVNLKSNPGLITNFDVVSTIGHFTASDVEIYASTRNPNYFYPRLRTGLATGVGGDLGSSLNDFNTNTNLSANYGNVTAPTLTTSISDNKLLVESTGTSYLHQSFVWKARISSYGETIQTASGKTGIDGGHGGLYGGGGGGGLYTGGNGANGCVFLSLGRDLTWPSIKNLISDYDATPLGAPGTIEELTPFEIGLSAQNIADDEEPGP
jgi:hypothetical protein